MDGASGIRYRPEHCGDSAPTNWTLLAPVTLLDNKRHYLEDPLTNHARCFYRAVPQLCRGSGARAVFGSRSGGGAWLRPAFKQARGG